MRRVNPNIRFLVSYYSVWVGVVDGGVSWTSVSVICELVTVVQVSESGTKSVFVKWTIVVVSRWVEVVVVWSNLVVVRSVTIVGVVEGGAEGTIISGVGIVRVRV